MPDEKKETTIEVEEQEVEETTTENLSNENVEKPEESPVAENDQTENPVRLGEEEVEFNLQEFLEKPEVRDFIQRVRKQEKDKLYGEIQKREKKIKDLEGEIGLLNDKLKSSTETSTNEQAELKAELQKLSDTVSILQKDIRDKELALFREKALKEAGDELILDLVRGETEEEITASIELAKTRYQEITEKAMSKKHKVEAPKPTNPQQPSSVKQLTPQEIAKMSLEEWSKHREMVKQQLGLTK